MTETATTAQDSRQAALEKRVGAIEQILLLVPVIAADLLLIVSLFLPFVTTEISDKKETANLFVLAFGLFGEKDDDGNVDPGGILFGIAFLVLLLVVIGSIVGTASIGRRRLSARAAGAVTIFAVLLVLGTAGAWFVMAMGLNSEDLWILEPALPVLTVGTLLAALVALLPAYQSIWEE